jgi:coatomer subunit zeta
MSLFSVNAILILNSDDGSRVFAKYYSAPHHTAGHTQSSKPLLPPPSSHLQPPNPTPHTDRRFTDAPTAQTPYPDVKSQKAFEKGLVEKTAKQTADIILYDNRIVLYKSESDVMMYVVGGVDENEIMLYNVILALRDSLHLLFKYVLPPYLHNPLQG